ncbi:MAG: hypothetical protein EZS28_009325 [Streblomastix strix]|uniref:Tyr recombinase domain-containing protein n=1 Tax=Streblomastix strix TaxID=222440 RepID=A0A5J4WKT5_9EUKA|nr:MAG: hypothetical protein EZS28_009325 [Streblomastix strix]
MDKDSNDQEMVEPQRNQSIQQDSEESELLGSREGRSKTPVVRNSLDQYWLEGGVRERNRCIMDTLGQRNEIEEQYIRDESMEKQIRGLGTEENGVIRIRIGSNCQDMEQIGNKTFQPNFLETQTRKQISENSGLSYIKRGNQLLDFQDGRLKDSVVISANERLQRLVGYRVSVSPHSDQPSSLTVPWLRSLGAGDVQIQSSSIRVENLSNNIYQDIGSSDQQRMIAVEKQNTILHGRHNYDELESRDAQSRFESDDQRIGEYGMGSEQGEMQGITKIGIPVPGMEMEYIINDNVDYGREETQSQESNIINEKQNRIKRKNKSQRLGKYNQKTEQYQSTVQTRGAQNKKFRQGKEQNSIENGLGIELQNIQTSVEGIGMVAEDFSGKQTIQIREKGARLDNPNQCVNRWMGGVALEYGGVGSLNCRRKLEGLDTNILQPARDGSDLMCDQEIQGLDENSISENDKNQNRQHSGLRLFDKSEVGRTTFKDSGQNFEDIGERKLECIDGIYQRKGEQDPGFAVTSGKGWRLQNQRWNNRRIEEEMEIHNYNGRVRQQKEQKDKTILDSKQRQNVIWKRRIEISMERLEPILAPSNSTNIESLKETKGRKNRASTTGGTNVERTSLVDGITRDVNQMTGVREMRGFIDGGKQNEEERMEIAPREIGGIFGVRMQKGADIFINRLRSIGLKDGVITEIIKNWGEQWRRNVSGLADLSEYLIDEKLKENHLNSLYQPHIFILNFLQRMKDKKVSDTALKKCRTAISTLLIYMGYGISEVRNESITQFMKGAMERTRKVLKEEEIWKLDQLLEFIKGKAESRNLKILEEVELRAIVMIMIMIFTTCRLAEIHRSIIEENELQNGILKVNTTIKKGSANRVELIIRQYKDSRICPVKWTQYWYERREKGIQVQSGRIWRIKIEEKEWSRDQCSKQIRRVMQAAGISPQYRVTSIRSAAITKALASQATMEEVGRELVAELVSSTDEDKEVEEDINVETENEDNNQQNKETNLSIRSVHNKGRSSQPPVGDRTQSARVMSNSPKERLESSTFIPPE